MTNAYQVKTDVVNEFRNRLYYNQLEIQRLLNNPAGISHKEVINLISDFLEENVAAQSAIELLENYIPNPVVPPQGNVERTSATDQSDVINPEIVN